MLLRLMAAASALLMTIPAADARRVQTDTPTPLIVSGYCDFLDQSCSSGKAIVLPYSVDFGAGAVNTVYIHGNGLVSFGRPIDFVQGTYPNYKPTTSIDEGPSGATLADIAAANPGVTMVSPGLNNFVSRYFPMSANGITSDPLAFFQAGRASVNGDTLLAEFFSCQSASSCPLDSRWTGTFFSYNALTIAPTTGGLLLTVRALAGRSVDIADVSTVAGTRFDGSSYFIPATILAGAVPEPATWLTMILGFAMVGAATRRSRQVVPAA